MSISRGAAAALRSSKDDIHSWTGAHDLKVPGQFQGVCSCSQVSFQQMIFIFGLVPMIFLVLSGQFQGSCSCS